VLLVVALVAATAVAAVALAAALTPRGGGGGGGGARTTPATAATTRGHASPSPVAPPPASIVSGGDTMADRRVKTFVREHGADAALSRIAPVLRAADVAWVNLESPLTTLSDPWPGKDVRFPGDPRLAAGLADAGVDLVNMADDDALDQCRAGLLDSILYAEANGIPAVFTGAAARGILVHMRQLSAALGTRVTISGDRGSVRSAGA
jgi:hypothetical protein